MHSKRLLLLLLLLLLLFSAIIRVMAMRLMLAVSMLFCLCKWLLHPVHSLAVNLP